MGSGGFNVIFENAMGNTLKNWLPVQKEIAKSNHTLSYDRLGIGKSDRVTTKRNAENMAKELHELLGLLEVQPPYVYVGASYGCFIMREYIHLFPDEVTGAVFVEPSHEDLFPTIEKLHADTYEQFKELWQLTASMSTEGYQKEWENYDDDCSVMRKLDFPDNIPVYIISSSRCSEKEQVIMNLQKEDIMARCNLHKQWLDKSPLAKQFLTDKSGHNVADEEPELVVSIVEQLINQLFL